MRVSVRAITNAISKRFDKKSKYHNPEYDDREIEGMMIYFHISNYYDLLRLLKNMCKG